MVGALLECHFKEQAIFPLLFAWGFPPVVSLGVIEVLTLRELPAGVFSSGKDLE